MRAREFLVDLVGRDTLAAQAARFVFDFPDGGRRFRKVRLGQQVRQAALRACFSGERFLMFHGFLR